MRSPLYALVSALLFLALCACATQSGQTPDAAKKPAEERYSTDRTIVGRGCVALTGEAATDRLEADQAARAEVAKQLEVKVIQVVEDMQREEQTDGKSTRVYSMSIRTQEFVDKTLKGVRIEARTRDEERGISVPSPSWTNRPWLSSFARRSSGIFVNEVNTSRVLNPLWERKTGLTPCGSTPWPCSPRTARLWTQR